jgi:hypothetical protein
MACLWATRLIGGDGACGELAVNRLRIDALHTNRRRAGGGEKEPDRAGQTRGDASRRQPCREATNQLNEPYHSPHAFSAETLHNAIARFAR